MATGSLARALALASESIPAGGRRGAVRWPHRCGDASAPLRGGAWRRPPAPIAPRPPPETSAAGHCPRDRAVLGVARMGCRNGQAPPAPPPPLDGRVRLKQGPTMHRQACLEGIENGLGGEGGLPGKPRKPGASPGLLPGKPRAPGALLPGPGGFPGKPAVLARTRKQAPALAMVGHGWLLRRLARNRAAPGPQPGCLSGSGAGPNVYRVLGDKGETTGPRGASWPQTAGQATRRGETLHNCACLAASNADRIAGDQTRASASGSPCGLKVFITGCVILAHTYALCIDILL